MKRWLVAGAVVAAVALALTGAMFVSLTNKPPAPAAVQYTYAVVQAYPHDAAAFTEGLAVQDGVLYESTGLYGASSVRRVDLETGRVLQEVPLSPDLFGEGLTIVDDTVVQLTWQEHIGFLYDKQSLSLERSFTYPMEGWGLTYDGNQLILSNGSDTLTFLNPATFQQVGEVQVRDGSSSVANLNELEYVNGDVYANVWMEKRIAVINPQDGRVKAWIDLTGLQGTAILSPESVLNGIAYDSKAGRLFVTGKNWPQLYEITLKPRL
ncbi:MAG: glutaminyl-peptide cyclotransferase [Candidatus Bathyarchaeia archaeon]